MTRIWETETALLKLILGAAAEKSVRGLPLGYGVIGNTTVSGTVILGSSPGIPAKKTPVFMGSRGFVFLDCFLAELAAKVARKHE